MSRKPRSRAVEGAEVTLALTPGQVVIAAVGADLLLRIPRGLRG